MPEDKKQDEIDLVNIPPDQAAIVDPKTGEIRPGNEPPPDDPEDEGDERLGLDDDSGQPTNRDRRHQRNQRRRSAAAYKDNVIRTQAERINALQDQINGLSRRVGGHDLFAVDNRVASVNAMLARARFDLAQAVEKGEGQLAAQAQEGITRLTAQLNELSNIRKEVESNARRAPETPPPQLDPDIARLADAWAAKNSWYNPKGTDSDSMLVRSIDQKLFDEGYDPYTREYWNELTRRVDLIMNEDGGSGRADSPPPRNGRAGPPVGGRPGRGTNTGQEFVLSRERIQAMKDAGIWEDPAKRKRTIQRYMQFDKDNNAA